MIGFIGVIEILLNIRDRDKAFSQKAIFQTFGRFSNTPKEKWHCIYHQNVSNIALKGLRLTRNREDPVKISLLLFIKISSNQLFGNSFLPINSTLEK